MKAQLPVMIQDPTTALDKGFREIFEFRHFEEDFFLDGPVTKRVALLDFDPATGTLRPPVRYRPPARGNKLGGYEFDENDTGADPFIQASVFGTVLRTMALFESERTLGRELTWAFDAPQLLVIPRAGEWQNAFYERESHSLQFFYVPNPQNSAETIYTALSRDIVAHETGHAIIDGIARDLHNNLTPQSLAIHEAVADLIALFMAFDSRKLREAVLRHTGGSIMSTTAFSSVAEEFGRALDPTGRAGYLRELLNNKTLNRRDGSADSLDRPNFVDSIEPHSLSEVFSGALYALLVKIHEQKKERFSRDGGSEVEVSGKALVATSNQFSAMLFRALDYLPPGEVSFADLGRAICAVEKVLFPNDEEWRVWLSDEFVKRRIVSRRSELGVEAYPAFDGLRDIDIPTLAESDWAAYEFANKHRDFLQIPKDVTYFRVRPRLNVTKVYYTEEGEQKLHECLFKVSWDQKEPNPRDLHQAYSPVRQVTMGTTLAIGWHTKKVHALLTSDRSSRQKRDRDLMLRWMFERNIVRIGNEATGPDGEPLCGVVRAEVTDGLMRIRETARMLHIVRE